MAESTDRSMLEYVLLKLNECSGTWPEVSNLSGVPYHTITKIASGKTVDPRISNVQKLHDYFRKIEKILEEDAA